MCTLTWTTWSSGQGPESGPESDAESGAESGAGPPPAAGYRLWFNRDEQRTRAPEVPPSLQVAENGVRYVAPADSEAGGTWITANERGVTVALLNGYLESRGPERSSYVSRGVLVRGLAGIAGPVDALDALSPKNLREFRPAVVFVKAPGTPALVVRWDGLHAAIDVDGERQLPLTSSGYAQDEVQAARRKLYRELVLDPAPRTDPRQPDAARLAAFQNYVDPELGPTPFTPSMSHPKAATRSQCVITAGRDEVRFDYRPGAPHLTDSASRLSLPLVRD